MIVYYFLLNLYNKLTYCRVIGDITQPFLKTNFNFEYSIIKLISDLNETLPSLAEETLSEPLIEGDDDDEESGESTPSRSERAKEHAIS